jgi:hypothetical protein
MQVRGKMHPESNVGRLFQFYVPTNSTRRLL